MSEEVRVLRGTSQKMNVDADGMTFEVRPLNAGEWSEVEAESLKGLTMKGKPGKKPEDLDIDIGETILGDWRSMFILVSYGAGMSVDEVKELPPKTVKALAKEIKALTGVDESVSPSFR